MTNSIGIIGGGSAAEALIRGLAGSDCDVTVLEERLLGGECPFFACMPSKSMLHDARSGRSWSEAVERRRRDIVDGYDDAGHVQSAREHGASVVKHRATITGSSASGISVEAGADTFTFDHLVVATGANALFPEIDGLDRHDPRVWTSEDALTATERPERVVIIGGGVIGSELAQMFSQFGSTVTTLDTAATPADDLHPSVSEGIAAALQQSGVTVRNGVEPVAVEAGDDDRLVVVLDGGERFAADRVIVAIGRLPATNGLGLENLGLDPDELQVGPAGQLADDPRLSIIGDVAGLDQYTHIANHQAAVVADRLGRDGTRRFDEVTVPACIFIEPPVMVVGPTYAELSDDDDVVWVEARPEVPRLATDELPGGVLVVGARRSTECIVAAHGIGPRFDELIHAVVVAIDGAVPVALLTRMIQPFPTVGELLGVAFEQLHDALDG